MAQLHAVATGDVIESSELEAGLRRELPDQLRDAYNLVREHDPEGLPFDLAILGGDGWQCYVTDPAKALPRVLHFWTLVMARGIRSRVAISIDTIDFIADGNLNESDGAAFRNSGQALEQLDNQQWFSSQLPASASTSSTIASESIAELVDHLMHEWTEAQCQAVAGMLSGVATDTSVTQESIAESWSPAPITRQSVNRHLQRAYWPRLERTLSRFEALVQTISE